MILKIKNANFFIGLDEISNFILKSNSIQLIYIYIYIYILIYKHFYFLYIIKL